MQEEHRHSERQTLFVFLEVLDREDDYPIGYLGDVSPDGMMFISETHYAPYQKKRIRIMLPEGHDGYEYVDAYIETRWTEPNLNPKLTCIGCRFLEIDEAALKLLIKVTENLSFDENMQVNRVMR